MIADKLTAGLMTAYSWNWLTGLSIILIDYVEKNMELTNSENQYGGFKVQWSCEKMALKLCKDKNPIRLKENIYMHIMVFRNAWNLNGFGLMLWSRLKNTKEENKNYTISYVILTSVGVLNSSSKGTSHSHCRHTCKYAHTHTVTHMPYTSKCTHTHTLSVHSCLPILLLTALQCAPHGCVCVRVCVCVCLCVWELQQSSHLLLVKRGADFTSRSNSSSCDEEQHACAWTGHRCCPRTLTRRPLRDRESLLVRGRVFQDPPANWLATTKPGT